MARFTLPCSKLRGRSVERRKDFLAQLPAGIRPKDFPRSALAKHRAIERSAVRCAAVYQRGNTRDLPKWLRLEVRKAAFGIERQLPEDCTHVRTRKITALAVTLWALARKSDRTGMRSVVQGFTVAQLASLSINTRTNMPCKRGALAATSHGATRRRIDDCGYLVALERVQVLLASQPPVATADPRYRSAPKVVGKDALGRDITRQFAFNVYWFRRPPDHATALAALWTPNPPPPQ